MAAVVRMTEEDLNALRAAAVTLEHPSLAARLGNIAGKPIELVGRALPEAVSKAVATATNKALEAALVVALRTMEEKEPKAASRLLHKALAAASGAVGGGFGLAALPVELPISTIIMLRSIGDVARSEGEDLADPESALACLQVYSPWGRAMVRQTRRKAGISLPAGCSPNQSRRQRASSPNAGCSRKARRSWSGSLHKSHPALEARCTSRAGDRRAWWCCGELRFHRPLSGGGACALRSAPTRTALWQECCPSRI